MLLPDDDAVYAFTRRHGPVELLVLGNFTGADVHADVDGWDGAEVVLGNYPDAAHPCGKGDPGALRPWEARVHRRVHG
jgi:oligo-1,6-glucosidase